MAQKKYDTHKYYLHSKSRKLGFKLITKQRTFYTSHTTKELPAPVIELQQKYGYGVQTELV